MEGDGDTILCGNSTGAGRCAEGYTCYGHTGSNPANTYGYARSSQTIVTVKSASLQLGRVSTASLLVSTHCVFRKEGGSATFTAQRKTVFHSQITGTSNSTPSAQHRDRGRCATTASIRLGITFCNHCRDSSGQRAVPGKTRRPPFVPGPLRRGLIVG